MQTNKHNGCAFPLHTSTLALSKCHSIILGFRKTNRASHAELSSACGTWGISWELPLQLRAALKQRLIRRHFHPPYGLRASSGHHANIHFPPLHMLIRSIIRVNVYVTKPLWCLQGAFGLETPFSDRRRLDLWLCLWTHKREGALKRERCNHVDIVFSLQLFGCLRGERPIKRGKSFKKRLAKLFPRSEAERITNHSYKALSQQAHSLSQYLFWARANGVGSDIARAHRYWTHNGLWVDVLSVMKL